MKKLLFLCIAFLITSFVFGQDIIVSKDGKKINAKVTEVNDHDIRYKNFDNLDGPSYTMKKSEISTIMYENGQVDVFNMNMNSTPARPVYQYTQDDFINAKRLRDAGVSCFVIGTAAWITGVAVAAVAFGNGFDTDDELWLNKKDKTMYIAGYSVAVVGGVAMIPGIVMWAIGQPRMNRIKRANPNGFSLFETEKVQLNLAVGGNNVGLKLNF